MNPKTKKIIAREGLVLIGVISCAAILAITGSWLLYLGENIRNLFLDIAIGVLLAAYPLYLIIRFIIWAVRTLKTK